MTAPGRLRVLLGAAPGVGKTCTMLAEGRRLLAEVTSLRINEAAPPLRREQVTAIAQVFTDHPLE